MWQAVNATNQKSLAGLALTKLQQACDKYQKPPIKLAAANSANFTDFANSANFTDFANSANSANFTDFANSDNSASSANFTDFTNSDNSASSANIF